jgi:polyisoprenoid-binding protein YceI
MKLTRSALAILTVILLAASAGAAEMFKVDPVHSMVVFKIKHLNTGYIYGRFNGPGGTFVLDDDPAKCSFELNVRVKSIDTANTQRDDDLKSAHFFDDGKYPEIRFKSTSVKKGPRDGTYEVAGEMSLHGVTKTITVTIEKVGEGKAPAMLGGQLRAGIACTFEVKRSDYGMNYMPGAVGDEVTLMVGLEGVKQ